MRFRNNQLPISASKLKVLVLLFLAVGLLLPLACGPNHFQHETGGAVSSLCATVMAPTATIGGSLFALVLIQMLAPGVYSFSRPPALEPIQKPPQ